VNKATSVASTTAYMLEHNRRRLIILLIILAFVVFVYGSRGVVEAVFGFLGQAPALIISLLFTAFALVAQFGVLMWFMSRPRKYVVTPDSPQIALSFDNYRGQPDLLEHAKSLVRILRGADRFQKLGGEMPKGMLLSGAPGTGKTFLAGVVAAEAGLPFIYIDASSLSSMFFGVDVLIVISLFSQARKLGRKYARPGQAGACILFMDELDSIGGSRSGVMGGQGQGMMGAMGMGFRGMALNTLLNQMDSLGQHVEDRMGQKFLRWLGAVRGPVPPKPVVFVIGATNRPDTLDAALIRPGRLDRKLIVYPPDGAGRRDIIEHYIAAKSHDPNIPIDLMIADSVGWTPVEIKTIINESLIVAHEDGRDQLNYKDWLNARDARMLGIKQPVELNAEEKRAIAYHEAGHAVVARYLQPENRTLKASIIRMGDALGVVQRSPREERHTRHAREIETDIMVSIGSRAVEEVLLGTKLTGAGSDLQTATLLSMSYVGALGMGSTLLTFAANPVGPSPQVLRMADKLLDLLYEETKRLIREKEYAVHAVAGALLEKGELIGPELEEVFLAADAANPDSAGPFQRQPIYIPKMDEFDKQVPVVAPFPLAAEPTDRPGPHPA